MTKLKDPEGLCLQENLTGDFPGVSRSSKPLWKFLSPRVVTGNTKATKRMW